MATVADLIKGSFRILGVLAASEAPTAAELQDGLEALNDMLDSWAGERLVLHSTLRSVHGLTPGLTPHTLGASGATITATRPVRIDRASIQPQLEPGAELPLTLLSDAEWQALQGKEADGRPTSLWVEASRPLMKLHLHPCPDVADVLVLYTWQQLGRFASTAVDFDLPPGYARAIRFNLARELAPEYGIAMSGEAMAIAEESKEALRRLNHRPSYLRSDPAILGRGGGGASLGGGAGGGGTDSGGLY